MKKTKSRIYVCHTFYHVFVSILKEMKVQRETPSCDYQRADIALSSISTDFENLGERLNRTGDDIRYLVPRGFFTRFLRLTRSGRTFFQSLQSTVQITAMC